MELNYDVLIHILDVIDQADYYATLYACSLVNHTFNQAASRLLYRKVVLEPQWTSTIRLGRREQKLNGLFVSARLPHNAPHVVDLRIAGYLEDRPPPINTFPDLLCHALGQWTNLRSFTFAPLEYPDVLITQTLDSLPLCDSLRSLTVGSPCCSEDAAPLLVQVESLESLTIENPSRAILNIMPDWLNRLSGTLTTLRFRENCGSITPGVLRSFTPHMPNVHTFALGLSYSLTHDDVFSFLQNHSNLQSLELRYYLQLRKISTSLKLPRLRTLVVRHTHVSDKREASHLTKFIHRLSTHSPLESLHLVCDSSGLRLSTTAFDGLADHLGSRHADTLRVLYMPSNFLRLKAFRDLCVRCYRLEELAVAVQHDVLWDLPRLSEPLDRLYLVSLTFPHSKPNKTIVNADKVAELLVHGKRSLRRLAINHKQWEGYWSTSEDGSVKFFVQPVPPFRAPWER
ncbi:unnamed protein product [Somion occarium]|uniref:F-box domain-containing protein n=1 Tax=Somion occarium TaxID=3059160 RepID=A0ABP1CP46_9APHY